MSKLDSSDQNQFITDKGLDDIHSFAPVIIPTLCRYDHFKTCIESLMRCTHAEKTDVFIGLDYPAKEEHWDGYRKISTYLDSIENKVSFKSLNIIRRPRNYGMGINGNSATLAEEVLKIYDSYIFSEDDNIFSPAFLDYINKGLTKFKSDSTILAINGYRHFYDVKFKSNSYFRQNVDFSSWGYGIWKDRIESYSTKLRSSHYLKQQAWSPMIWINLLNNGFNRCLDFISMLRTKPTAINDNKLSVFMVLNNQNVIVPTESLVRNMGWDDSGMNSLNNENLSFLHHNQHISDSSEFTFKGTGYEYYRQNKKIYRHNSYARISWKDLMKRIFTKILHNKQCD